MLQIDPVSGVPLLTAREQEVLLLVAHGLSAKEIAQRIDIAPRTVERHIENVRLKIRARNRTHMVTLALELGLLHVGNAADTCVGATVESDGQTWLEPACQLETRGAPASDRHPVLQAALPR